MTNEEQNVLKECSTSELIEELLTRKGITATERERQYIDEYPVVRRDLIITYKYNVHTEE